MSQSSQANPSALDAPGPVRLGFLYRGDRATLKGLCTEIAASLPPFQSSLSGRHVFRRQELRRGASLSDATDLDKEWRITLGSRVVPCVIQGDDAQPTLCKAVVTLELKLTRPSPPDDTRLSEPAPGIGGFSIAAKADRIWFGPARWNEQNSPSFSFAQIDGDGGKSISESAYSASFALPEWRVCCHRFQGAIEDTIAMWDTRFQPQIVLKFLRSSEHQLKPEHTAYFQGLFHQFNGIAGNYTAEEQFHGWFAKSGLTRSELIPEDSDDTLMARLGSADLNDTDAENMTDDL